MSLSLREFEKHLKRICDRWYVEGGNVCRVFETPTGETKIVEMLRPVTVWEKPYSVGKGFTGPTKVMIIGNFKHLRRWGRWEVPTWFHLRKLEMAHWRRRRLEHIKLLAKLNERRERQKESNQSQFGHDTGEFLKSNRKAFAKASEEMGITKGYLAAYHKELPK